MSIDWHRNIAIGDVSMLVRAAQSPFAIGVDPGVIHGYMQKLAGTGCFIYHLASMARFFLCTN
jgi:hypothetical protein